MNKSAKTNELHSPTKFNAEYPMNTQGANDIKFQMS